MAEGCAAAMEGWQPSQAYGHGSRVFDLAFHPTDPTVLASASEDSTARIWRHCAGKGVWQQANCCKAETEETLRVQWSPDGAVLATGSADGIVRVWEVGEQGPSYSGEQVAALRGHPEEIYGIEFPAATRNKLVVASGESLYLWDLSVGRMVHEARPLGPDEAEAGPGPSSSQAAAPKGALGPQSAGAEDAELEETPPYIFCLDQQPQGGLLATSCCDGAVRLWEVGRQHLECIAEAQVHPDDMGSACSFSKSQPNALACMSKGGQLTVVDVRRGGPALQQGQLVGPVLAARFVLLGGAELLAVVGRDSCVRLYDVLAPGQELGPPQLHSMPGGYQGPLLAVAASADGSCLAAAGNAVPIEQLRLQAVADAEAGPCKAPVTASKARRRRGTTVSLTAAAGDDLFEPLAAEHHIQSTAAAAPQLQQARPAHGAAGHGAQLESLRAPLFIWSSNSRAQQPSNA